LPPLLCTHFPCTTLFRARWEPHGLRHDGLGRRGGQDRLPGPHRPGEGEVPGLQHHPAADPRGELRAEGPDDDLVEDRPGHHAGRGEHQRLRLQEAAGADRRLPRQSGLDLEETFGPVGANYTWEDATYGVPDRSGAMVLYYNKDLFDEAGVEYPTAEWDWDTFLEAAQALTDPSKGQYGYGGVGWWPQWFSLVAQNGGHVLDPETGAPNVNSPEAVEALQFAYDLYFTHEVAPTEVDYSNMGPDMGADGAFQQGLVAMNSTGFWAVGGNAKIEGLNWDIAPFFHGAEEAVS